MSIIYVLIPIAMLFVLIAVAIFFWAVKTEQFDDLDRQSVSILFDEDTQPATNSTNKTPLPTEHKKADTINSFPPSTESIK
ncbi:cbb3-type cytochrome oxidase assembly protein CcoS [Shewanella gaetbuli]|uniref:Cbb3-type cytochrome oxidase assembly protein CcoS n=1 Tax=Shewanella gaetbuli TaxID=220752 RepID=A0A9X1ZME6_9GAMM|nr:cbb3-type cytochrome oxidase assembly protein CcoS [Shewanella gaetbuli]MCL1142560.1 cbb3-type cytochrome oxidase assembly protein CcoS [Shewanella gaetbuli]